MKDKDIKSQLEALIASAQTPTDVAIKDLIGLMALSEIKTLDEKLNQSTKRTT